MTFRPGRTLALLLVACAAAVPPLAARDQKTVFHGLPVEPDTGFLRPRDVKAITFDPIWLFEGFAAPLVGDPVAIGDRLAAVDRSGRVVSIDAAAGNALWSTELGEPAAIGPAVAGDLLLLGTDGGLLIALGADDGHERWRVSLGAALVATPVTEGTRLLVLTAAPEVAAIDRIEGRVLSRLALPGRPLAPSLGPDGLVIGTVTGQVVAAGGEPLELLWSRDLGHSVTSPPLIDRKHLFVATDDRALWRLRAGSGRTSWKQRTGSRVTARPRVIGDLLYVACWDNDLYVLGRKNGHILGRARLGHRLSGETTILADHLFVAPTTEATVIGLTLPYLGIAGKHELGAPGEWFTTAPVASVALGGVAVGWGRSTGKLVGLRVADAPEPPPVAPAATATP